MKYVNYDSTSGKILGWYDDEIHKTIPKPNSKVDEDDWKNAINNNLNNFNAETKTFSYVDETTPAQLTAVSISEKKAYLSSTDWIVTKITEEQIRGNDIAPLLTKYATVLTAREDARAAINSLELQL